MFTNVIITYIYNGRHSAVVQWLCAVWPHVRTLCQVYVSRTQTARDKNNKH